MYIENSYEISDKRRYFKSHFYPLRESCKILIEYTLLSIFHLIPKLIYIPINLCMDIYLRLKRLRYTAPSVFGRICINTVCLYGVVFCYSDIKQIVKLTPPRGFLIYRLESAQNAVFTIFICIKHFEILSSSAL